VPVLRGETIRVCRGVADPFTAKRMARDKLEFYRELAAARAEVGTERFVTWMRL
jgi:hypothetical protein